MKPICLLIAVTLFMVMINIDYTAVNLALVTISHALNSNLNTMQWLLSAYTLAWAAVIIPAGKLSDIYGRKCLALIGLVLFVAGSLFAGGAHAAWLLILGRIFQGLAGAFAIPALYGFICVF